MKTKSLYGRLKSALTVFAVIVAVGLLPMQAAAVTVSKSFTTHSVAGDPLLVFGGESLTFTISGTYSGTVYLQQSQNGSDYKNTSAYFTSVNGSSSTVFYANTQLGKPEYFRVYCSTHQSGTIVTSIADVNDVVQVFKNLKGADVVTINDDGLAGSSLADSAIVTAKLATDAVVTAKILDDSITSSKIINAGVSTAKLATDAVIAANILTGSVTTSKIATDAVIAASILTSAVTTSKIIVGGVVTAKLYLDVATLKVACITTGKTLGACTSVTAATGVCNSCN